MAIVEILKYSGKKDVLAWKYPSQELGTWTQVIVNESQEAVFVKEGKILDILGPGRHTLSTENIPILSKIINLPFGGKSPFTAEVWFINKVNIMDVKWGTPSPIQLQDPKYKVFIPVRSFGQFGVQINDSGVFLRKIIGTLNIFDQTELINYFRGLLISKIKDNISSYLIEKQVSILEINAYINEISDKLKEEIQVEMDKYGINIINFYITSIDTPEEDTSVKKLKEALAKKAEMEIVGYNYTQERSFNTLEEAAKNEGTVGSSIMGAGIGLGMGVNMGGVITDQMKTITDKVDIQSSIATNICSYCNAKLEENQRYCPECGKPINNACSKCGAILKNGQKFCSECGEAQIVLCPKCKKEVENGQKFCANCGEKIEK